MSKSSEQHKRRTPLQRAWYRLVTSALAGLLTAAVVVVLADRHRHAAVAADAAAAHQGAGTYLAAVFGGIVLAVTVAGFVMSTIVAAARPRPAGGQATASPRGRRRYSAGEGW
jgi:hypothetical protein